MVGKTQVMMRLALVACIWAGAAGPGQAAEVCTLIAQADSGVIAVERGACDRRVTPASTFKLALAVMGYDSGMLVDAGHPVFDYAPGDPDWGGADWTRATTPTRWLRYSVVWYSQRITRAMGADTLTRYARAFSYGNADFSGDAGFDNGLERAWIASSLLISPREQVAFLRALIADELPASPRAMAQVRAITQHHEAAGWRISGKTGAAYPRRADQTFDYDRGWGWYVGWAEKDGTRIVFARLTQDAARQDGSPGSRLRAQTLASWPALMAAAGF